MNRGRISRHRNNRRGPESIRRMVFCLRCLDFGHYRNNCRNDPIVSCGTCFRAYYFGTDCPCAHPDRSEQTLRMVGGQRYPRPCIDVTIGSQSFEAFINQSTSQTTINRNVLNHINVIRQQMNLPAVAYPGMVQFPIRRRHREVRLDLEIREQRDDVILGNDFLTLAGFSLTLDRVSINERSPVVETCKTIEFIYNMPQGEHLKSWLDRNHSPLYNKYKKGDQPELQLEPRVVVENDQYIANPDAGAISDADVLDIHPEDEDLNEI